MMLKCFKPQPLFMAMVVLYSFGSQIALSQVQPEPNAIQTAVPFLTINPDARSGALGNTGVANTPDVNSQHWNPAKYAFIENNGGISASYSPQFRALISDNNHFYLVGYKRLKEKHVLSGSIRLLTKGTVIGVTNQAFKPYDLAIDIGYSRIVTNNLSGGLVFRFIYSDLGAATNLGGSETKPGKAFSGDLGILYRNDHISLGSKNVILGLGMNASNIGSRIAYTTNQNKAYLPVNLRIGAAFTLNMDEQNSISLMTDLNKLLVPTPPIYLTDSNGTVVMDSRGNPVIEYGKNPYVAVPVGMVQSFFDAPGVLMPDGSRSVIREELNEITIGLGIEYLYKKRFAVRGGYFNEHETKGDRKYFTTGLGLKFNVIAVDICYLIPLRSQSPYKDTFLFTLSFGFGKKVTQHSE